MILSFLGGIMLGIIFFGGLYWTVQQLNTVQRPALLMLISTVLRMAVLLTGLYFIMGGDYRRVLIALAGVILVKLVMTYIMKKDMTIKKES
ncbi:MAG: ATP synthase subunit I [Halanaerobiales bacterium]